MGPSSTEPPHAPPASLAYPTPNAGDWDTPGAHEPAAKGAPPLQTPEKLEPVAYAVMMIDKPLSRVSPQTGACFSRPFCGPAKLFTAICIWNTLYYY